MISRTQKWMLPLPAFSEMEDCNESVRLHCSFDVVLVADGDTRPRNRSFRLPSCVDAIRSPSAWDVDSPGTAPWREAGANAASWSTGVSFAAYVRNASLFSLVGGTHRVSQHAGSLLDLPSGDRKSTRLNSSHIP